MEAISAADRALACRSWAEAKSQLHHEFGKWQRPGQHCWRQRFQYWQHHKRSFRPRWWRWWPHKPRKVISAFLPHCASSWSNAAICTMDGASLWCECWMQYAGQLLTSRTRKAFSSSNRDMLTISMRLQQHWGRLWRSGEHRLCCKLRR